MSIVLVLLPQRLISADSCARPSFAPARDFSVGPHPTIVVVGDFNNDSNPDLAVANKGEDPDFVSLLLGNGDGTFQAAVNYTVGTLLPIAQALRSAAFTPLQLQPATPTSDAGRFSHPDAEAG